jgi:tRNA-splicing ligase RtcB
MDAYFGDLYWAQEYAARNRAVMMALFQQVVTAAFDERGLDVEVRRALLTTTTSPKRRSLTAQS